MMMSRFFSINTPNKYKSYLLPVLAVGVLVLSGGKIIPDAGAALDREKYFEDLEYLASFAHRLPGSEEAAKSADYIENRLRQAGIEQVTRQSIKVPSLNVKRCEMQFGEKEVPMLPMRPNVTVPPVTPPEGLTGPLLYVGSGEMENYGEKIPEGTVVFMDYDSLDNWEKAFSVGAKAVVFIGDKDKMPSPQSRFVSLPFNLVRLYVEREDLQEAGIDLTASEGQEVTLYSEVTWNYREDSNIIARIPGTDPTLGGNTTKGPETIVMSAAYDTYGEVPHTSPGARRAANVASLLAVAESFQKSPPARDTLFMFLGNRSYNHQGAREVYDALMMPGSKHDTLVEEHEEELEVVKNAYSLLQEEGLLFDREKAGAEVLHDILKNEAQFARDDIAVELQVLRMRYRGNRDNQEFISQEERKEQRKLNWDTLRRALYERKLEELIEQQKEYAEGVFKTSESRLWSEERKEQAQLDARQQLDLIDELHSMAVDYLQSRQDELNYLLKADQERVDIREIFLTRSMNDEAGDESGDDASEKKEIPNTAEAIGSEGALPLHISFDFSDQGTKWAPLAVHHFHRLLDFPTLEKADAPGYYKRILAAFREAAVDIGDLPGLVQRALRDPLYGNIFVPGWLAPEGLVAGSYGVYNIVLSTGFDRRLRDGHPSDTLNNLDAEKIISQSEAAVRLIREVASRKALSQPSLFSNQTTSNYPGWGRNGPTGHLATKHVMGGMEETRPARGVLMAFWPGQEDMTNLANAGKISDFMPFSLEQTDVRGRFRVIGARPDISNFCMMLGIDFNQYGQAEWIVNQESIAEELTVTARPELMNVSELWPVIASRQIHRTIPGSFRVLSANTNTTYRPNEALWGNIGPFYFAYISASNVGEFVKFFQPLGPVIFGEFTSDQPWGEGLSPEQIRFPIGASYYTHQDLWKLNEQRLATMRERGVSRIDLENLHSSAKSQQIQSEEAEGLITKESLRKGSASLSHRTYAPLLSALDDLVVAIVILLLFSIPFAFAMERLLICATSIHGRIGGFIMMFGITFALLYWMHPGFAISATPIIIFLAFTILLLSSIVIYLLLRKFDAELKAMQGQSLAMHNVEVSRTGTMLAAVGMGMSTMRRRPTRTFLSAITVVILTYTILCFAAFTRHVGVRTVYEGGSGEDMPRSILVRNIDFSEMPEGVPDLLRGYEDQDGLVADQQWITRKDKADAKIAAFNPETGDTLDVGAAMGITPAELQRWDSLAECLTINGSSDVSDKVEKLADGQIFLPRTMIQLLNLEEGDSFYLHGQPVVLGGAVHSANLQSLRNVDNMPVLPVDFANVSPDALEKEPEEEEEAEGGIVNELVQLSFNRMSVESIIIGSSDLVRRMGGSPHIVNFYPGKEVDISERGDDFARLLSMPVWVASVEGVERKLLTYLTELEAGLALIVPLILGGFIIFGTLLGSISDREKEIYTFSALGLSPGHVGMLFFAEAAVYAVVGGMGGQLLAQATGLVASVLAERQIIQPVAINFSSTHSLFAIMVVMAVVMVSSIYPAFRASRSANPGLARSWRMPMPEGDYMSMTFPFTVSSYDITGVVSFLAEHFRAHDDAGLGSFAAANVGIDRNDKGNLHLEADITLAPFDLGVSQHFKMTAEPSEIEGVDEVKIDIERLSGAHRDWIRSNRVFLRELRKQFLVWRTLDEEVVENYRVTTMRTLGEEEQLASTETV